MAPMIPMPVPHALAPAQPSGEEQAITSMLVEGLQEIRQREQKDGFAKVLGNVLTRCIGGSSSSRDDRDRDRDNVDEKTLACCENCEEHLIVKTVMWFVKAVLARAQSLAGAVAVGVNDPVLVAATKGAAVVQSSAVIVLVIVLSFVNDRHLLVTVGMKESEKCMHTTSVIRHRLSR